MQPLYSIIIPAYNAQNRISTLLGQIAPLLASHACEVLIVDDASTDNTWQTIQTLTQAYPSVRGMQMARNQGQHRCTWLGMQEAKGQYIITMDDDGEHDVRQIPMLLHTLQHHDCDVVYGVYTAAQHPMWRRVSSQVLGWYLRKIGVLKGPCSAFRALRTQVVRQLPQPKQGTIFLEALLAQSNAQIRHIPIMQQQRIEQGSTYTYKKLAHMAWNILAQYHHIPRKVVYSP